MLTSSTRLVLGLNTASQSRPCFLKSGGNVGRSILSINEAEALPLVTAAGDKSESMIENTVLSK